MTNQNDLTDALTQNGAFDAARANEVRENAIGSFDAKLRTVDRWLMAHLFVCCCLIVFALFQLVHVTTTKAIVVYALLFLVFFETTILVKLWYWTMNSKISVLKAIKLMELRQSATTEDRGAPKADALGGPLKGISRREKRIWTAAIAIGCAAIGAIKGIETPWASGSHLVHDGVVSLAADGSGPARTSLSIANDSFDSIGDFNFFAPEGTKVHFLDNDERELPFNIAQPSKNGHVRYEVALERSVKPGQRHTYTRVTEPSQLAAREQDVWTYMNDQAYGYDTTRFSQVVVLPPGAEVVSASPWPAAVYTLGDRTAVRFEATRGRNERFKYSVQYRLPASPVDRPAGNGT